VVGVARELLEGAWKAVQAPAVQVPGEKSIVPFKKYPLADKDESWSGPKEIAAAEVPDLKLMSTWYDSESPDVKGSYKLPHHRAADKHTVWRGTAAAMGVLLGARGGVAIPDGDRKGVYNHLAKHYKEFDEEPPEFKAYSAEELEKLFGDWLDQPVNRDAQIDSAIDAVAELVCELDKKVATLSKRLDDMAQQPTTPPEPTRSSQPVDPDEIEIDLADPATLRAIREEIGKAADDTLRRLRGQLPD